MAYKIKGVMYITFAGAETFAQKSNNPHVIAHRENILGLLKAGYASLRATTRVNTSKPYDGKKNTQPPQHASPEDAHCPNPITALSLYWPNKHTCNKEEFENAVERFFGMPEFLRVEAKMEALEDAWVKESMIDLENAVIEQKPITGYVYALWNPFFTDLLKIGATFRTSAIRARELSGTGMPEPFVVVAQLECRNPFGMEREIHKHFDGVRRYGKKKEFFTLTSDEVIQHFKTLLDKSMAEPSDADAAKIKKRLNRKRRAPKK